MLACGCAAMAKETKTGQWVCGTHNCREVVEPPDLTGRMARCYCSNMVPSDINLAFFKYRPNKVQDEFFCGCGGWD